MTAIRLLLALLCLASTARAADAYPIPFFDSPDWHGFASGPSLPGVAVLKAHVGDYLIVLVPLTAAQTIDSHQAARVAYENLFSNVKHLPDSPVYVVVVVYGPENSFGMRPEYAYVFRRDLAKRAWAPRPVSKKELAEIHCVLGHRILYPETGEPTC